MLAALLVRRRRRHERPGVRRLTQVLPWWRLRRKQQRWWQPTVGSRVFFLCSEDGEWQLKPQMEVFGCSSINQEEGKNTHNPLVILALATGCSFFAGRNDGQDNPQIGFLILHRSKLCLKTYVKYFYLPMKKKYKLQNTSGRWATLTWNPWPGS
jgi:hypothetical protein